MRARVVVFPIKGREWCFSRSMEPVVGSYNPFSAPQSLRDLLNNITSTRRPVSENAEIVSEFVSDKMNRAWGTLEIAPEGTFKSKLHSFGLWILSRVKPSEVFLKSVSKDLTGIEITYPTSLNPRLVRRRLRHIALRGSAIHRKHLYGSITLLPLTSVLTVLPLPNVPFFWVLFRAYSHWKALKGSERLLLLASDNSSTWNLNTSNEKGNVSMDESDHEAKGASNFPWVLDPSEDLEKIFAEWKTCDEASISTISAICEQYGLDKTQVFKFKNSL